ncbi:MULTISPECIES: PD-(D/E)XK motif protein [unclassified Sphingomonas]|uniref:PD-(D/E)XK motif protein n=1 Tax=unclassified Sphingomonas TaxID=196159 RepID=UPI000AF5A090|nr:MULTISPECIES: PD-(D/E)XK motif protein [unclassified Sphingomonas]
MAAVVPGDRLFRTRRLAGPARLDLRVGLRETDGAPCLVVSPGAAGAGISSFETGGLRLSRVADPGGVLLVLSLEEPARRELFAAVCSDCLRAVMRGEDEADDDLLGVFAARLSAWRAFLRDQIGALSRSEMIGIIGELLLFGQLTDIGADALATWRAPDDGLHDFEMAGDSIEVKTSLGGARQFHVSTLDQLDDAGLTSLHVAHVRLIESPDGETLADIADRIETQLDSERARGAFRNALLRRGLAPGTDDDAGPRVRLAGTDFYAVRDGFPRLRRGEVALGIAEATYELEVRALAEFQADGTAVLSRFGGGQ